MTDEEQQAAIEAAQRVVDEVSSYQYSAEDSTIAIQLDQGLRQAQVSLPADERERILSEIDDMKDESSSAPQVRTATRRADEVDVRGLLTEGFGRITELYDGVAEGLEDEQLHHRPGGTGNPIGWLLWHLARVQDDHVADLAGGTQVWERFQDRFGLPNGTDDIGYGHSSEQVDAIRIEDPTLLVDYHHEVTLATARYLETVDEAELEREVDQNWDPPVTAGQRLVSIQGDCLQHLGQAAYVKGLLGSHPS